MANFRIDQVIIAKRPRVVGSPFTRLWRGRDIDRINILESTRLDEMLPAAIVIDRDDNDKISVGSFGSGGRSRKLTGDALAAFQAFIGYPVFLRSSYVDTGMTFSDTAIGWIARVVDGYAILTDISGATQLTEDDLVATMEGDIVEDIVVLPLDTAFLITSSGRTDSDGVVQPDINAVQGQIQLATPFQIDPLFNVDFKLKVLSSVVRAPVRDPRSNEIIVAGEHRLLVEIFDRYEAGLSDTPIELDIVQNALAQINGIKFRLDNFQETDGISVVCEYVRV